MTYGIIYDLGIIAEGGYLGCSDQGNRELVFSSGVVSNAAFRGKSCPVNRILDSFSSRGHNSHLNYIRNDSR